MNKILITIILAFIAINTFAQIPYFAGTAGNNNLYGYTSVKFIPTINNQETYTTFQYGVGNHMAFGMDLFTGLNSAYIGYTARFGIFYSKYFNIGAQVTPSFDLNSSHKFGYFTGALYLNGAITKDGNLMWVSNTWVTVNRDKSYSLDNWWYLGYYFNFSDKGGITPMIGILHSWKFNQDPTPAVGFYYTYKNFNFYAWTDRLTYSDPRIVIGIDFKFGIK